MIARAVLASASGRRTAMLPDVQGLDYAYGRPDPAAVRRAGYVLVARYVGDAGNPKCLTADEARALRRAGLDVVLVFERDAARPLDGAAAGADDGRAAKLHADLLGAPAGTAIYAAVDFDVSARQMPTVLAYLTSFRRAVAPHPAGVYGGYATLDAVVEHAAADYLWQAGAWSYGRRHPRAQLRQRIGTVEVAGVRADVNDVIDQHYGGWAAAEKGRTMATLDADDLAAIKAALREVLDEGTGRGQPSWAATSARTLAVVEGNHNMLGEVSGKVDDVVAGDYTLTVARSQ